MAYKNPEDQRRAEAKYYNKVKNRYRKKCQVCGDDFSCRYKSQKFCSKECVGPGLQKRVEKTCKTCGKKLNKKEIKYCKTCKSFHKHRYSKDDLEDVLNEYERWDE